MRLDVLAVASVGLAATTSKTVWVTPHDSYSSSIGVLGCKIDTNRVAYWPEAVTCDNICVSLSYQDRQVYLLRVDQSGGAHDVSYDAWNYLYTGSSAADKPVAGGAIAMTYAPADPSKCKRLINTKHSRLPLSAANSMNYLSNCLTHYKESWVAQNYQLYNILDPICTMGKDESCKLDFPDKNQASCRHALGVPEKLTGSPVWNLQYPTGKRVLAGSVPGSGSENGVGRSRFSFVAAVVVAAVVGTTVSL